ncbi:hypothetical protein V5799_004620 [Amblyomma americanum]|uniref:Uncharacterized protein n=1 Tax=Amblyomma americanum TaxID=6943 RepID=A0AAQ4D5K7_AMBAM
MIRERCKCESSAITSAYQLPADYTYPICESLSSYSPADYDNEDCVANTRAIMDLSSTELSCKCHPTCTDRDYYKEVSRNTLANSKVSVASSKGSGGSQQSKASSTSSKSSGRSQLSKASRSVTVSESKATSSTTAKAKAGARKANAAKVLGSSTPERASKARGTSLRSDVDKTAGADAETKDLANSKTKRPSGTKAVNPDDKAASDVEAGVQSKSSRKSVPGRSASGNPDAPDEAAANMPSKPAALVDGGPNKTDGKSSMKGGAVRSRFSALRSLLKRKSLAVLRVANVAKFATRRASMPPPRERRNSVTQPVADNQPVAAPDAREAISKLIPHEASGHSDLDSQQQRWLALCGALSLTVLMLIFFSVATYFLTKGTTTVIVACETPECIAAKAYVEGLLGDPKDRCTDFYSYVCARLIQDQSSASEVVFARLHDGLLRERGISGDKLGGHVAATVYSGCYDFLDWEESLADEMRETGQSIMTAPLRSAANFSEIVQLLVRISFQRGLHTVLVIGLVRIADGLDVSLSLSPGNSVLRKFRMASYDQLERNLKAAFSWAPQVNTSAALKELVIVDKRVEQALAASDEEAEEASGPLRRFVGGLVRGVDASVWVTAVKDANPGGVTISAESECFAKAFTAIRSAFRELSAVGVRRAASYLAANLEAEVAFLEDARQNLKEDAAAKRRFCLELTRRSVALTWHPLAARILHSAAHEASVRGMFGALRDVLGRNSVAFTWLDPEVRVAALNRLSGTALILIDEEMAQQVNASYEKFMPVIAEAKDFVSGYVSALKETQWLQTVSPPSRLQALCAGMELTASIEYKPWLRSIVVPPMLLAEPYFYGKALPLHFNYGTVGSLLASRVAEVLGADNPQTGGTNGTDPIYIPIVFQAASLWTSTVDICLDLCTDSSFCRPLQGLRVAYEALLTWFTTVAGDSDRFQHHWHAAQVLFFARFCLLSCSADRRPTAAVPGRDRCLVPLHNMRQFAETFECGGAKGFVTASCPL